MKKNKKKILIIISIILLVLIIFIVIPAINYEKRQKEINKELFNTSYDIITNDISFSYTLMNYIGSTMRLYWYEAIFDKKHNGDIDEAVKDAKTDNQSYISLLETYNDGITTEYKYIKEYDCKKDSDCISKQDAVIELYPYYTKFYELINNPNGYSYYSFSSEYKDRSEDLQLYLKIYGID